MRHSSPPLVVVAVSSSSPTSAPSASSPTAATAASPSSSAALGQLPQPGVDGLLRLNQHVQQVLGLRGVAGREEGVGRTGGALTSIQIDTKVGIKSICFFNLSSGSADAVDVVLGVARVVEVNDEADVVDI